MKFNAKSYKKKLDRMFQELGRKLYTNCFLCGGEYSCLHHFIHKSQSNALRWDIKNGVPVCNKCHCRIHSKNDPEDIWIIMGGMNSLFPAPIGPERCTWEGYLLTRKRETFRMTKANLMSVYNKLKEELGE